MNRAAWASRFFFLVALIPAIIAAGYTAYQFHTQPPPPPYRQGGAYSPQIVENLPSTNQAFLLGAVAPASKPGEPAVTSPPRVPHDAAGLYNFDSTVNRRANLTVKYVGWRPGAIICPGSEGQGHEAHKCSAFPARYVIHAAALGAETVIELTPSEKSSPTLAQIAAGTDAVRHWLVNFAAAALGPRDHFILSFAPEMNGNWWQYGAPPHEMNPQRDCKVHSYIYNPDDSSSDYVRAFRYVHNFLTTYFDSHHANGLVKFMWQPSAIHKNTLCPIPWWPGQRYVDEIGLDGYFYYPYDTFKYIFERTLTYLRKVAPRTPIMLGETAVGRKLISLRRAEIDIQRLFVGIQRDKLGGLIWYDSKKIKPNSAPDSVVYQDYRLFSNTLMARTLVAELPAQGDVASFSETYVTQGGRPLIPLPPAH